MVRLNINYFNKCFKCGSLNIGEYITPGEEFDDIEDLYLKKCYSCGASDYPEAFSDFEVERLDECKCPKCNSGAITAEAHDWFSGILTLNCSKCNYSGKDDEFLK